MFGLFFVFVGPFAYLGETVNREALRHVRLDVVIQRHDDLLVFHDDLPHEHVYQLLVRQRGGELQEVGERLGGQRVVVGRVQYALRALLLGLELVDALLDAGRYDALLYRLYDVGQARISLADGGLGALAVAVRVAACLVLLEAPAYLERGLPIGHELAQRLGHVVLEPIARHVLHVAAFAAAGVVRILHVVLATAGHADHVASAATAHRLAGERIIIPLLELPALRLLRVLCHFPLLQTDDGRHAAVDFDVTPFIHALVAHVLQHVLHHRVRARLAPVRFDATGGHVPGDAVYRVTVGAPAEALAHDVRLLLVNYVSLRIGVDCISIHAVSVIKASERVSLHAALRTYADLRGFHSGHGLVHAFHEHRLGAIR